MVCTRSYRIELQWSLLLSHLEVEEVLPWADKPDSTSGRESGAAPLETYRKWAHDDELSWR